MSQHGLYSAIQIMPDPSRGEAVNLGVVLFVPSARRAFVKMAKDTRRVRRLFPDPALTRQRLSVMRQAFRDRLVEIGLRTGEPDQISKFIGSRGDIFRLTSARPLTFETPEETLDDLFQKLVAEEEAVPRRRVVAPFKILRNLERDPEVKRRLRSVETIHLSAIPIPLEPRKSYQNGVLNLLVVDTMARRDAKENVDRVLRYRRFAEELNEVSDGPERVLALLTAFDDSELEEFARRELRDRPAKIFTDRDQVALRDDILKATPVDEG